MLTYQDFEKATDRIAFIARVISEHRGGADYRTAEAADLYDRQLSPTMSQVTTLYDGKDAGKARICCNLFARLNTDRVSYLLGNGISFTRTEKRRNAAGVMIDVDVTKEQLGSAFDEGVFDWARFALIHGKCFAFWDLDRLHVYPITQFAPIWDEETGALRAGVRFWRIDSQKPMNVILYETDGVTKYKSREGTTGLDLVETEPKRAYKTRVTSTEASGVIAEEGENYGMLPVIPMYGNKKRQSTLVGMRARIDSIDLVASGFARDMADCTKIYWLIQNCGGMDAEAKKKFLDEIREDHIANVDTAGFDGDPRGALSPYVQDVPYQGNEAYLNYARGALYEDFGAVDVHTIAAGATNDHIDAAYQPMDNEVDEFEKEVTRAIRQLLKLIGIDDTPKYKRNRVSNVKEQIEAVMLEARLLDDEAALDLLPNVTVDMKEGVLARRDHADAARLTLEKTNPQATAETGVGGEVA